MMEEDGQSGTFALYNDNGCQREIIRYLLERERLNKLAPLLELTCTAVSGAGAKASSYLS